MTTVKESDTVGSSDVASLNEQLAIKSSIKSEVDAFIAQIEACAVAGNALKPLALSELARRMGAMASEYGRPTEMHFIAHFLAMYGRNMGLESRFSLAKECNRAALGTTDAFGASLSGRKPVWKTSAKGNGIEGGLSYKLNLPAKFEVTLG